MKTKLLLIWLIFVAFHGKLFAQVPENFSCGTKSWTPEEVEQLPFYKNSKWLIDQGRKKGIPIPENYLETITDKNAGRSLASFPWAEGLKNLEDKRRNDNGDGDGEISIQSSAGPSISYVKIKAYVWMNSNGTRPVTNQEIRESIDGVNQLFLNNAVPIRFYLDCNIIVQTNNDYSDMDEDDYDAVAKNSGRDDFEIHFVNRLTKNGEELGGVASLPRKTFGIDDNDNYCIAVSTPTISVVVHEIGHALGLNHTHDGGITNIDSNIECGPCFQESVSRTRTQEQWCDWAAGLRKCAVNGDLFCDTPADPNLFYGTIEQVQ